MLTFSSFYGWIAHDFEETYANAPLRVQKAEQRSRRIGFRWIEQRATIPGIHLKESPLLIESAGSPLRQAEDPGWMGVPDQMP